MSRAETRARQSPFPVMAIFVLALLSAAPPLAIDMYLPAFPVMADELHTDATAIQVTLTSFLLGLAVGQLIIGPLSDRFGRRGLLLTGTAVAIVSGLLCAITADIGVFIALRIMQGLGGAAGVVLARAIIADRTSDEAASARLFLVIMVIVGLAPALAPIIGAGIVEIAGWRAVFWVLAFLSALSFAGTFRYLDESLPQQNRTEVGFADLAKGIVTLLGNKVFVGYALTVGFSFMVMFAYIAASPFVFQGILGLSPITYSIAFGVNAIGIAAASAVSARLVSAIDPRQIASAGLLLITGGTIMTLLSVTMGTGASLILPSIFVAIASIGLIIGNAIALAIREAPRNAGTASAVIGALQFSFGAMASPLVGLAGEDTAFPMAVVMVAAAALAVGNFVMALRGTTKARAGGDEVTTREQENAT